MKDITGFDPSELVFSFNYEEFEAIRHPEDGEMMYGSYWFVQAETVEGYRFRRDIGFATWEHDAPDEFGPQVKRVGDPKAFEAAAEKLTNRLNEHACPKLNPDVWFFSGACYGSDAYIELEDNGMRVL